MHKPSNFCLGETEQDPVVPVPTPLVLCLLSVENFSQRTSLIREMRNTEMFCFLLSVENFSQRVSLIREMKNTETKENEGDRIIIM